MGILKTVPNLKIFHPSKGAWGDRDLREAAWIVRDYVHQNPDTHWARVLQDWLNEYDAG